MLRVELGRVRILILILRRGTDTVTWDLADLALPADGAPLYSMAMGSLHPALSLCDGWKRGPGHQSLQPGLSAFIGGGHGHDECWPVS